MKEKKNDHILIRSKESISKIDTLRGDVPACEFIDNEVEKFSKAYRKALHYKTNKTNKNFLKKLSDEIGIPQTNCVLVVLWLTNFLK